MAIKTIFVAASGGSATAGSIELACQLAQRFRAHIEGYHVLLDPQAALAAMGEEAGLGLTGTLIESIEAVARVRAEETHCHAKGLITALCRQNSESGRSITSLTAVGFRTAL